MARVRVAAAIAAFLAAASATAQNVNAPPPAGVDETIVVKGERKALRKAVVQMIAETDSNQIARYERDICPMVVGLPADWTAIMTRMIRNNIAFAGRRAAEPGCKINALAIFTDRPRDLLRGLQAKEPTFFGMTPRAFDTFVREERPAYSWQITDTYGSRGQILRQLSTLTYQDPNTGAIITTPLQPGTKVSQDETGSRLVTGSREEIEVSFVAIDRDLIDGRTLRQLADFATLHLMLTIRPNAGAKDPTSILSLFEKRPDDSTPPMRMSAFDRGALRGLYVQRHNNRTASQQQQNIVKAIEKGAGGINE